MKREQILAWMKREAEEGYKNFSASLLPEVPKERILGVRLPKLRKLAAVIVKEGCQEYLAEEPGCLFEEVMLRGMVIGADGGSFEKTAGRIRDFLPYIDNWSVCDSFCSSLKGTKEYPEKMWPFLLECLQSGETYTIRFALVMMLQYYVSEKYRKQALDLLEHILYSFSGRSDGVAGTLWPGRGCLEKGAAEDSGISSGISGREG